MRNRVVVFLLLGASLVLPAFAASDIYRVVGVSDGDTLTAYHDHRGRIKCRLYGIDAPEKKQAYGQASKASLAALSFGRSAAIDVVGRDRYGRSVCKVAVGGVDVNREQLARGMAWMYRQYTSDRQYSEAEADAQLRRMGVWRDNGPVPPWEFRRRKRTQF